MIEYIQHQQERQIKTVKQSKILDTTPTFYSPIIELSIDTSQKR